MPRSSRHKSHKQSKHKEAKDFYSDSDEDVKMKERNSNKEEGGSVRAKDSSHSASGEKRKLSSSLQLKEGKDGKDLGNGDASGEYVSSKRRKEKVDGGSGSDRWNGGGDDKVDVVGVEKEMKVESSRTDSEKGFKSRESKGLGDSKSKSSKRHESSGEKEEKSMGSVVEKEEGRSGSRSDSKRKSEKESGRKEGKESKEVKEKERGYDRDKKGQESKRELEIRAADGDGSKKQASQLEDAVEDRPGKRGRENTELALHDECRNPELEKELEKRTRRRREGSGDRDRYQDARENDERHLTSKVDRSKDGKHKDERYKDGSYGDKYQDTVEKDDWHRDDKYREDDENRRDDVDRDSRRRDDKYREEGERENRRREDKYHEDGDRDDRRRDDKYREDGERDGRRRDNKYREDSERENKRRDDKYREDGDRDSRRDDRYNEDGERDDRHRDDKYREDGDRYKEDKLRDDYERENRYRDGKQGDGDREKRFKEAKCREERSSRDRSGDKSDSKHAREESVATELHPRKSSIREGSPNYDDRTRGKDDQGRKRSEKEGHGDVRSRSTKDQRCDSEKRSSSSTRVDLITDRGRPSSRNADRELTPSRIRHQSSPSSVTRDHYRVSKLEEPKYREYAYEERARHTATSIREYCSAVGVNEKISSSRSIEKVVQKEDGHLGDLPAERRLKMDNRTSPRQLIDKSPSSASADRRHFSRSDVRRSIDVEESGQRSGSSKDPKDYTGREGRGSRDLAMDTLAGDDLSQGDGDTLSVSSPFARPHHLSGSSRSLLPPHFRMSDSPSNFGSSEDDSRMKFSNRHRRMTDPNMGRVQGSPWKGVPNWPSPMANGFMPFQHGPPPVGFHPMMQQFPAPPIFGVRPSMELNHPGVPYHITDADRFSGHGRPMGWRNPVDDSLPPPMHGWDTNNTAFAEESHLYGRPEWEHGRAMSSGQGWEASGDMWKGPKNDASMELSSVSDKENQYTHGSSDVGSADQSGQQAKIEPMQPDAFDEPIQSSDALKKKPLSDICLTLETINVPKMPEKDDAQLCHVYFSVLDISAELSEPELYSKCTGLISLDDKEISKSEESKILYLEDAAKAKQSNTTLNSCASLFATASDSVFQKAMMLYKKQRKIFSVTGAGNSEVSSMQNTSWSSDEEKQSSDDKAEELVPAGDETQPGDMPASCDMEAKASGSLQNLGEISTNGSPKMAEAVNSNIPEKPEDAPFNECKGGERVDDPEVQNLVVDNSICLESAEPSGDKLSARIEEMVLPSNSTENQGSDRNEEETMPDTKCGSLVLSEVSSKACEVEMLESIESGSVNLSRIHHSPENTH